MPTRYAPQTLAAVELERRKRQKSQHSTDDYQSRDGIVRFVRDVIGATPTDYQVDILQHFAERRRVAIRGPHGLGKTAISAWCVLWAMGAFPQDVKVVTTAGSWVQLTQYTWPEIRKWGSHAAWGKIGKIVRLEKELLKEKFLLPTENKAAFAVASANPELAEGAHAAVVVYIFDEAKAIPAKMFEAAEGAFSTGLAFALAISTPGDPSGVFYDIHSRKKGYESWWTRHVTLQEAIDSGRINPEWAEEKRQQWGDASAVYQNRVLGEFAASGSDSVIPLAWVELANERWRECGGKGAGDIAYGVDVARSGEDKTVVATLRGKVVEALAVYSQADTMETVGRVVVAVGNKQDRIAVDVIGIGAGVYDRLRELQYNALGINVSVSTDRVDRSGKIGFLNLRAAIWWALREALDPDGGVLLALPPNDDLTGDLTAPTWKITSSGKIQIEAKEDIRKRIGRSPDAGDAVGLAYDALAHGNISNEELRTLVSHDINPARLGMWAKKYQEKQEKKS